MTIPAPHQPITVGIYGAEHPHVFSRIDLLQDRSDARLIGLWEPDPVLRARHATDPRLHVFDTVDEFFSAAPDLAILEGMDRQNPDAAIDLAKAGIDLLIEKPGAVDPDRMRALVDALATTGVHAEIGYMLRHSPAMVHLRALLESGVLGSVTLARCYASSPVGCAAEPWQSQPEGIGGITYTIGCHMVDVIQQLFGVPEAVSSTMHRASTGATARSRFYKDDVFGGLGEERDFTLGRLEFEDSSSSVLVYPDSLVTLDVTGWDAHGWVEGWRIEIVGTNGTVYAGLLPGWVRLRLARPSGGYEAGWHEICVPEAEVDSATLTLAPDPTYATELDQLLSRIARGDRSQQGLADGLAVIETLDSLYRSAADNGRRVAR